MANTDYTADKKTERRFEAALNEIATGAGVLRELLGNVGECLDAGNHKGVSAKILAAETLVAKIGWIADAEALAVCGSSAFGGADHWLLSPAYQEAKVLVPEVSMVAVPADQSGSRPLSVDDEDTVHTLVTQAKAIVSAMSHALLEATEGGGRTGPLSESCIRDNLWAASDLLYQAEAILESPREN